MINKNKTLSISIMSGKGGVGKSNLSLGLGYAFYNAGLNTMLMDCDLGLANLDVLLGISPEMSLQNLLQKDVRSRDVVVPLEDRGLDILPAASGVPELVDMDEDMQSVLLKKIMEIAGGYQILVLDIGAGISETVLSFAGMAQLRFVVVTPEPTSLTDSYAMIKVLHNQYGVDDFSIVVNQATKSEAKQTFDRLNAACNNFLGIEIRNLGFIRHDPTMVEAVRRQKPLMKFAPDCPCANDITALAQKIIRYREDNQEAISARPALNDFSQSAT